MNFDKKYIINLLKDILKTDSPTGFTEEAMKKISAYAAELGFELRRTKKGGGIIEINVNAEKTIGLSVHIDTLGLMVRSVNENGSLKLTNIGMPITPTLDGEYCKIYTRTGDSYTGTILSTSPSIHVYPDAISKSRELDELAVVIDEIVKSKKDVAKLGINSGDFICIDTKTCITESDFIKSRFLDDKASVAIIFGVLKNIKDNSINLKNNLKIFFSVYEEVGHGLSYLEEVDELLAVDMGCIGMDLNCTEQDVSICAKDSSGPYNYFLTNKLIEIAKKEKLKYAVDIYPKYGSDVSAANTGGNDFRGALIGPGVSASHGMERTHYNALLNTMKLILNYLLSE